MHLPVCPGFLRQLPAVACFERYIRQLYLLSQSDYEIPTVSGSARCVCSCLLFTPQHQPRHFHLLTLPNRSPCYTQLTRCLQNLLFEVPLPPPGKTLAFGATAPIILQRPATDDLPLFQYSMRRLFSLFEARRIVQLVTCGLLEQQIILKSKDYELLSLVAECVTTLMYPFLWQHVYVPILPSTALHFIEAPVPFIMGLHTDIVVDSPTEVGLGRALVPASFCTPAAWYT